MRGELVVKISIPDPMKACRAKAADDVNEKFAVMATQAAFLERTHARKRQIAQAVMNGAILEEDHPFAAEAKLRGLPQEEFARDIVYKPDVVLESDRRELLRQKIMLKLDAARTPGEVAEVMHEAFPADIY